MEILQFVAWNSLVFPAQKKPLSWPHTPEDQARRGYYFQPVVLRVFEHFHLLFFTSAAMVTLNPFQNNLSAKLAENSP